MALTSKSSFVDILAEYNDCASYDLDGDVDKAKRFIVACRFMLNPLFIQDRHRHGLEESEISFERIENLIDKAEDFVAAGGANTDSSVLTSFENYRD